MDYDSVTNQEIKSKFVQREVLACFSFEMEAVLKASSNGASDKEYPLPMYEEIENLYEYKCPECGEVFNPDDNCSEREKDAQSVFTCPNCGKVYESQDDLENEPQEIFEWWIVSTYLYRKLKDKGEPVLEWGNNNYWGRTCSGQAIMLDGVISEICEEAVKRERRNKMKATAIKSKAEARQKAIDWQAWQGRRSMSTTEVMRWAEYFRVLGKRFGLLREFKENGII